MSLFQRRDKAAQFTIVGNQAARDPQLSLKAKGLLLLMLSFSEGWTYRLSHIETLSSDKEHATKSALHELMAAGYILREKQRNADGTFQWVYTVDDEPFAAQSETTPQFSTDGSSTDGKSRTKKNKTRKPSKEEHQHPSTAHAAGEQAVTKNPVLEESAAVVPPVVEPASQNPKPQTPNPVQVEVPITATAEPSTPTDLEKVPGAAAPAREPTEHQAMMGAIREALYPGVARCADRIEARLAGASKQLRTAGLSVEAPAGVLAMIRQDYAWRKIITPETLVDYSAEWASKQLNPPAPGAELARPAAAAPRPVGRPNSTAEATQRSVDTASSVLAHLRTRRPQE